MASEGAAPAAAAAPKPNPNAIPPKTATDTPPLSEWPKPVAAALTASTNAPVAKMVTARASALLRGTSSDSEESDSNDCQDVILKAAKKWEKTLVAKEPTLTPASIGARPSSAPTSTPTAPAAKRNAPAVKPNAPAVKPKPATKPTAPAAKPTAPAAKPTAPAAKPTAPAAKPTAPAAVPAKLPPPAQKPQKSQKRKRDSDDEDDDDDQHDSGNVSELPDESEEEEDDDDDDSDDEPVDMDGGGGDSSDDSNAEDDAEEYDEGDDSEEEDKPARERNKLPRVSKGATPTYSSSSSSSGSKAMMVEIDSPPSAGQLAGAELRELTAPVRARVAKWQERSALGIPATARERIDQYVQVLATGKSSVGMLSAALSLNDELLARLEETAQPAATLSQVERDNVQEMGRTAGAFAKGTLSKVRDAIEESKRTTSTLEAVLQTGESVLKTNIAVLEAFGRRGRAAPVSPQPV